MNVKGTINRFGFYTALLFLLSNIIAGGSFFAVVIITAQTGYQWDGVEGFAAFYQSGNQFIISLAWSAAFVNALLYPVLLSAVHFSIPQERRILTQIGIIFGSAGMIIACGYEYLQLTLVRQGILSGSLAGLDTLVIFNPQSVVSVLSYLGWMLFIGIALLATAFVFIGGGVERWIKILLAVTAVIGITAGISNLFAINYFALLYFLATTFLLSIAAILLAVYFRRGSPASHLLPQPLGT